MGVASSFLLRGGLIAVAVTVGWFAGQHLFDRPAFPLNADAEKHARDASRSLNSQLPERNIGARRAKSRVSSEDDALMREGRALADRWPDSKEEARRRAFELAVRDPLGALTMLNELRVRNFEGVTTWEREIMIDWARRDQGAMLASLEETFKKSTMVADHLLSISASIAQIEHREGLEGMLGWMADMERSGSSNLTLVATSKLLAHLTAEGAQAVRDFLFKRADEPAYRDALVQLANAHAHKAPESALKSVESYPDPVLRQDAMLAVVAAVAWDNPVTVIDWLNSGKLFSSSGLADLTEAEATKLRDEVLTTYFVSLISAHPNYVAKYSDAVSDPKSREYLKNMAEAVARTEKLTPTDYWQHDPAPESESQPSASGLSDQ